MRMLTNEERRRRRFTDSFRREQVALIEKGEFTVAEIGRLYHVKGSSVKRWLKKFGKKEVTEQIIIGSQSDYNVQKVLEKENKGLKQIIGEQQIKIIYLEHLLELAKDKKGDDFEKK